AAPPELHALAVHVVPRGAPMPGVSVGGLQLGLNLGGQPGMPNAQAGAGAQPAPTTPGGRLALQNPMGNTTAAELDKAVKDIRKKAQETWNEKKDKDGSELANYAAVLEQARDLVMATKPGKPGEATAKSKSNEGPSVTYHLAAKLSVPSRRDDQVIEV